MYKVKAPEHADHRGHCCSENALIERRQEKSKHEPGYDQSGVLFSIIIALPVTLKTPQTNRPFGLLAGKKN
jgi:hypothetical protein